MENITYNAHFAMSKLSFSRATAMIVGACAFIMMAADAFLNYAGAHIMAPGHMATAFAAAAFVAVIVKFFWLSALVQAIRAKAWHVAVGAVCVGLMFHAYSIFSAMGLASVGRDEVMSARGDKQEAKARALEAYNEAKRRVDSLAGQRPSETVLAAITAAEGELKVAQAREADERKTKCGSRCETAMADTSAAQSKIAALKGDLALSVKAEQAKADIIEAKARLETIVAPKHIDPLAAGLATYLPFETDTVSKGIPLLPTLIVEFGPGLTLMIAAFLWTLGAPTVEAQPIQREVAVATRIIEAQPQPVAMLPEPLKPEEQALRDLRELIAHGNHLGRKTPAAGRPLVEHFNNELGRKYSHSTFAGWAKAWVEEGKILKATEGKKVFYTLPPVNRFAARQLRVA
jgi:hypothetical protein